MIDTTEQNTNPTARPGWRSWLASSARRREVIAAGVLLALGAGLRLALAMQGWPYLNSDEAVIGLMSVDIWHGAAHPIFSYNQDYIGALQAYIAAPIFALLNGDPLALRLTTLLQTVLFLVVMYALARRLFGVGVALLTLALLSFGPEYLLRHQLQAGAGAQDTLLFGALVVWLATVRLRGGWRLRARLALDAGIGLAVGLGLWGDFLFLPYVALAGLALGYSALRALARAWERKRIPVTAGFLALDLAAGALFALIGAAPFIYANIPTHFAAIQHVLNIAGAPGAKQATISLAMRLHDYARQIAATALVGLPYALGSVVVCNNGCVVWPASGVHPTVARALHAVLINAPFTIIALGLWLVAAWSLARGVWRAARGIVAPPLRRWGGALVGILTGPAPDARWWGRAMLVCGAALTVAQYAFSQASYEQPNFTNRYLIGIYIATPIFAAPLFAAAQTLWRALSERRWAGLGALGATALLALTLGYCALSVGYALRTASDRAQFGDPLNSRDVPLVAFLKTHNATRFRTGYWTCLRLELATREELKCAIVNNGDAFAQGFNRYPSAVHIVDTTPHPAWVFDMRHPDVFPIAWKQIATCVQQQQPLCKGYVSATVNGYVIYYYPH